MGSFLDKPITDKETLKGQGNDLLWGLSSMQGWRVEMEDAHTSETDIANLPGVSFFAVYDGHGGSTISELSAKQLLPRIMEMEAFAGEKTAETLSQALHDGVLALDAELRLLPCFQGGADRSGSTAITCFITETHIIFGNCGDSRGLLARSGNVEFATDDHKPTNEVERARISKAGGFIEMGRVCGNLAVSRALGDYAYKDKPELPAEAQKICCDCDMTTLERMPGQDQFVVLACDGIWDVMTNEDVVRFVTERLKAGYTASEICEEALDTCLKLNSKDNMSFVLILLPDAPKAEEGFVCPEFTSSHPGNMMGAPPILTQTLQSLLAEQIGDNDEESTQEVPDGSEDQGEQASAPHASPEKPV